MADDALTPRDLKAVRGLLQAKVSSAIGDQRHLWQGVLQRLETRLASLPPSLSPKLCGMLNAARSQDYSEVDRIAKMLADDLVTRGDFEGGNALRAVTETPYKRPAAPAGHQGGSGVKSASTSTLERREPAPPPRRAKPKNDALEWFEPDPVMAELMVLDAATGPLLENLHVELMAAELFLQADVDAPTRVLFSGPPGTGKTTAARWLGWKLERPVAVAKLDAVVASHLGETARNVRELFDAAREVDNAIVFLDEIDGMCQRRGGGSQAIDHEMARVTSSLLQQLDMLPPAQVVIAATNFPEKLDPALRRRLSSEVLFANPDDDARKRMLDRWWAKVDATPNAHAETIRRTKGRSGDFLRTVAMRAARVAIVRANNLGSPALIGEDDAVKAVQHQIEAVDAWQNAET